DSPAAGTAVYFEIQSIRPLELTFSFTPEMLHMWPAPNHGRPNGEWVSADSSGYYILHTDDPRFSAVVAMPNTKPGIMVPYQEHPQTYPLELKLAFDPRKDGGLVFPLTMAIAQGESMTTQVKEINSALPQLYADTQRYYAHFFDTRLTATTPDRRIDEALRWAELAIDQAQVKYHAEIGLIAGYYESADSARPGYAWFFGRDTLWTTYAINSYGDFALTRRALDFLFKRQRDDGKIMHEYSQSADALDWKTTPYFYASADSTPLLVMAMWDYVRTSGDTEYLKTNWPTVRKAYEFTQAHLANDGIYDNSQGTGWVESWPQGMPKEEIYMAAVDQQASNAVSHLATLMQDTALASSAKTKAADIASKIQAEFYDSSNKFYAFSRNPDGSLDQTASIYPAVAWWDGTLALKNADPMLSRWASPEFSTDWGTRDISAKTGFFDPISYHQGSIWPLFTGWVSLAEYRAGHSLSGYAHLMQNAEMTWTQDLGSVTELLSGEFFQPLGRSSSHQLWSSAMVLSPALRGLFGLDWDALNNTLRLAPHLPADWDSAELRNVPLGSSSLDLQYRRTGDHLTIEAKARDSRSFCLATQDSPGKQCTGQSAGGKTLSIPLDPVELAIPANLPLPGAETAQLKVLAQNHGAREASFTFSALGGSSYTLPIRLNRPGISAEGGELSAGKIRVHFPEGNGYQTRTVTFRW
ncbi:MAG: glycogen debranching protein, partial [Acidobacteriota bacterium]|nr:glycogen debranching protein [Acidobacteriota bacterium]